MANIDRGPTTDGFHLSCASGAAALPTVEPSTIFHVSAPAISRPPSFTLSTVTYAPSPARFKRTRVTHAGHA